MCLGLDVTAAGQPPRPPLSSALCSVTEWVLLKRRLRQSLGCKMFSETHNSERKGAARWGRSSHRGGGPNEALDNPTGGLWRQNHHSGCPHWAEVTRPVYPAILSPQVWAPLSRGSLGQNLCSCPGPGGAHSQPRSRHLGSKSLLRGARLPPTQQCVLYREFTIMKAVDLILSFGASRSKQCQCQWLNRPLPLPPTVVPDSKYVLIDAIGVAIIIIVVVILSSPKAICFFTAFRERGRGGERQADR